MEKKKTSPIVVIAFFPIFVLKYAYIGILAILGLNKKRHLKQQPEVVVQNNTNMVQSVPQVPQVPQAPVASASAKSSNVAANSNVNYLEQNKTLIKKETVSGNETSLYTFNYTIRLNDGKLYKNSFDAPNIDEVRRFLVSEGYEVVKIVPRSKFDIDITFGSKMNVTSLAFTLTQLSTYLKAGIPLVDSIRIIAKQTSNKMERRVWDKVTYALLSGKSFSEAMMEQEKVFPSMLINMIRTAEMTGALTEILDDMADYYSSVARTKKEMKSAMTYPAVIMVLAIIVPKFSDMFEAQNAKIPGYTKFILGLSGFLKSNYFYILFILIVLLVSYRLLFKNIKAFRRSMQSIYMKLPVFGKIIIYNEVTVFTKTFASLINHGVKISDSMDILLKITDNEIYKELIADTISNLTKGKSVSEAFKGSWAFPVVAYEMLVTGENTGQLGTMMSKVSDHFNNLHKTMIDQMKSLIEPFLILFLGVVVGGIILAIIVPMFSIYGQIS